LANPDSATASPNPRSRPRAPDVAGFDGCFVVVGDHCIGEQPDRWSVHEDQRRTLLAFGVEVTLIFSDRVQDQSIDPTTSEGIDHDPFAVWIVVGAGRYDGCVPTIGHGLDSAVDRGREWVVNGVKEET
jgi:hypothetical protein